jgi:peptidoglycan/LPS O-acetylase OafA/YrhL
MRWWMFLLSAFLSYVFLYSEHTIFVAPAFVTIALYFPALLQFRSSNGYAIATYGIYLYGTPIVQANIALFPFLRGHGYLTFAFALVSATAFAAFSWNVIDQPTLALKRRLPRRLFPEAARQEQSVRVATAT